MKMRNPFQAIGRVCNNLFGRNRKKIEREVAKVKNTKVEVSRSSSGTGGRSGTGSAKVSNDKNPQPPKKSKPISYYGQLREDGYCHYEAKQRVKGQSKRRKARKVARKSRRINRICRQQTKKVA